MKQEAPHVNIERSIIKQFRKEIWRPFVKGLQDYEMIKDGDKVAVCISGGKDSMLLAKCLQQLKRQSRTDFELEFIVMDPGYNPDNRKLIPCSFLIGAIFLIACDIVSRALRIYEIPIGIVTAIIGTPVFLVLLVRINKGWSE